MFLRKEITTIGTILGSICFFITIHGIDWQIPDIIASGQFATLRPRVEIDNNGNAVAVFWVEDATSQEYLLASQFTASTQSWSSTYTLDVGRPGYDLIVYPTTGHAIAAWADSTGTYARYYDGTTWSTRKTIISADNGGVKIALDSAGNVIIGWIFNSPGNDSLYATYYPSGQEWSTWYPLWREIGTTGDFGAFQIMMDQYGDAFFAWIQDTAGFGNVLLQATWYDNVTESWLTWSPVVKTITNPVPIYKFNASNNLTGNFVIAWDQGSFGSKDIKATHYDRTTDWSTWDPLTTPALVKTMPKVGASAEYPTIAIDNSANVFISWLEDSDILRATRCETTWSSWTPIAQSITNSVNPQPLLTMDNLGNVFLLWDVGNQPIYIQSIRYDQTPWALWNPTDIKNIAKLESGTAFLFPILKTDNSGNAITSWLANGDVGLAQASLYNVSNDEWESFRNSPSPIYNATLPEPDMAMNIYGASVLIVGGNQSSDPNSWQIQPAWSFVLSDKQFLNTTPGSGTGIAADSDGVGNVVVATIVYGVGGTSIARVYTNPFDVPPIWRSEVVSSPSQENVRQVDIATMIIMARTTLLNSLISYIDQPTNNGECYVRIGDTTPERVSITGHNAQNSRVAIQNNARIEQPQAQETRNAVAYINNRIQPATRDIGTEIYKSGASSNNDDVLGPIYVSLYNPSTGWTTSEQISTTDGAQEKIEMDGAGNVFVVWKAVVDEDTFTIQARQAIFNPFTETWNWQAIKDLSVTTTLNTDMPQLAADAAGNAIFTWRLLDSAGTTTQGQIQATRYPNQSSGYWNSWDPLAETVNLSAVDKDATDPRIDMDSPGNAIIAWRIRDDNNNWRAQAARFDTQTKTWAIPPTTTTKSQPPRYLSPANQDVELISASVSEQGNSIVSYAVTGVGNPKIAANTYNPNTKLFSNSIDTGLLVTNPSELVTVANYNDQVGVVVVDRRTVFRSNGNNGTLKSSILRNKQYPQPPVNAQLRQELHRFPTQADLINVLSWQAGDNTAVRYELYADADRNSLITTIQANQPLCFMHHCRRPGISETYYLFAINAAGNYSDPVVIH